MIHIQLGKVIYISHPRTSSQEETEVLTFQEATNVKHAMHDSSLTKLFLGSNKLLLCIIYYMSQLSISSQEAT